MKVKLVEKNSASSMLKLIVILSLLISQLVAALPVEAQTKKSKKKTVPGLTVVTVRGRVDRKGETKTYPAAYVKVGLVPRIYENDETHATVVYTGIDGMYYFHVSPAVYVLRVWVSEKDSKVYLVEVSKKQYVDVAPIIIP